MQENEYSDDVLLGIECPLCGTTLWAAGEFHPHHVGEVNRHRRNVDLTLDICVGCHNLVEFMSQNQYERVFKKRLCGKTLRQIAKEIDHARKRKQNNAHFGEDGSGTEPEN